MSLKFQSDIGLIVQRDGSLIGQSDVISKVQSDTMLQFWIDGGFLG